jgi:hypothetical protein
MLVSVLPTSHRRLSRQQSLALCVLEMIPPVHARVVTMLALPATAMLIAGCGRSSHHSPSGAAPEAGMPISSAQALAYAHAVNLRTGDVPATTRQSYAEVVRYPRKPGVFARCAGLPAGKLLMEIQSPVFNSAYWWTRSTIAATSSEAFAAAYAWALASPRGGRCLLPRESAGKTILTALPVTSPFVGIRVGWRNPDDVSKRSHREIFAFASRRAVFTLTVEGEKMPALTTEQHLLSRLYTRAKEHKL